jgi:myo-inositol-1(or 4)-monophosphatase
LNICYVASGVFDANWEWDLQSWDMAGGAVIALEAGCALTSLDGKPFEIDGHELVVSNKYIHDDMIKNLENGGKRV